METLTFYYRRGDCVKTADYGPISGLMGAIMDYSDRLNREQRELNELYKCGCLSKVSCCPSDDGYLTDEQFSTLVKNCSDLKRDLANSYLPVRSSAHTMADFLVRQWQGVEFWDSKTRSFKTFESGDLSC